MKLVIMQFFQLPVTSYFLGRIFFLSALFLNTLNRYSFLNFRDQVSHPYVTAGEITLIFTVLDKGQEDKIH